MRDFFTIDRPSAAVRTPRRTKSPRRKSKPPPTKSPRTVTANKTKSVVSRSKSPRFYGEDAMRDWAISLCCRVVRRNMHEALLFLHAVSKPNNNGLTPRCRSCLNRRSLQRGLARWRSSLSNKEVIMQPRYYAPPASATKKAALPASTSSRSGTDVVRPIAGRSRAASRPHPPLASRARPSALHQRSRRHHRQPPRASRPLRRRR